MKSGGIEIEDALAGAGLDAVHELCRAFRLWLYARYPDDRDRIDAYYNPADFERLLASLPARHGPPAGTILLARLRGRPAGCIMLDCNAPGIAEMHRLFVAETMRGQGVGQALAEALMARARAMGYHTMRLDTGPFHHEAQALYRRLGFEVRDAYYDPGPELRESLVFMERSLRD